MRLVGGHNGWRNGGGVGGSEFIDCGKNMFMDEVIRGWGVGSEERGKNITSFFLVNDALLPISRFLMMAERRHCRKDSHIFQSTTTNLLIVPSYQGQFHL